MTFNPRYQLAVFASVLFCVPAYGPVIGGLTPRLFGSTFRDIQPLAGAVSQEVRLVSALSENLDAYAEVMDGAVRVQTKDHAPITISIPNVEHITALALDPDGKQLAVGFDNHRIEIWNVRARSDSPKKILHRLGQTSAITALVFLQAAGSDVVASCDKNRILDALNLDDGSVAVSAYISNVLGGLAFWSGSKPGARVLIGIDELSKNAARLYIQHKQIKEVPLPHDAAQAVIDQWNRLHKCFEEPPGSEHDAFDKARTAAEAVWPLVDGFVASTNAGGGNPTVGQESDNRQKPFLPIKIGAAGSSVGGLAFYDNDARLLSADGDSMVRTWNVAPVLAGNATNAASDLYSSHSGKIASAVLVSDDGSFLVSGGFDSTVHVTFTKEPGASPRRIIISKHDGYVLCLAIEREAVDRYILASGGSDGRVVLCNVSDWAHGTQTKASYREISPVGKKAIVSLGFSPDHRLLAAANLDGRVYIWRLGDDALNTGALQPTPAARLIGAMIAGDTEAHCVQFLNNRLLATAGSGSGIKIWYVDAGKDRQAAAPIKTFEGVNDVYSLAYSPARRFLAAGTKDTVLCIWQLGDLDSQGLDEARRQRFQGADTGHQKGVIRSLVFSRSGDWLASGGAVGDSSIVLLKMRDMGAAIPH